MNNEFFEGVIQLEVEKEGQAIKLPIFYQDVLSMTASFTASTKAVKKYLPHPDMKPIEFFPGRCMVAFTAFEYRKCDIDPYNEFSISVLIKFKKTQIPFFSAISQLIRRTYSTYVWHLPVTTEVARVGGVELYGYPKFIADIDFKKDDSWVQCDLSEKGQKILSLRGQVLETSPGKRLRYITYTIKDNVPLVTNVFVNPIEFAQSRDSAAAQLEIGTDHPICKELRSIDLGEKSQQYMYSPVNQAILFSGRNLMDI
jgi:hypothetical protein